MNTKPTNLTYKDKVFFVKEGKSFVKDDGGYSRVYLKASSTGVFIEIINFITVRLIAYTFLLFTKEDQD